MYVKKSSSNLIVGSFKDNQMIGLSIVLKENESIEDGKICITENKKSIPVNNENQRKNLMLHNEYKKLRNFYENNSENIKHFLMEIRK